MSPPEERESLQALAAGEMLGDSLLSLGRDGDAVRCYAAANARNKVLAAGTNARRDGMLHFAADAFRIVGAGKELLEVGDLAVKEGWTARAVEWYSAAVEAGAELSEDQFEFLKTAAWDCFEGRAISVRESADGSKSQVLISDVPAACSAFRILKAQLTDMDEAKLLTAAEAWWAEGKHLDACAVYRLLGYSLSAEQSKHLKGEARVYKIGGRLAEARLFLEVLRDDEGLIALAKTHLDRLFSVHTTHENNRVGICAEAIQSARELYEETGGSLPPHEIVDRTAALIKAKHLDTAMLLSMFAFPVQSPGGIGASETASTSSEAGRT
jgi:hypothetical protein